MKNKKLLFFWLLLTGLLGVVAVVLYRSFQPKSPRLLINDHTFYVEVANDDEKRVQGLSGRTSLTKDRGMLFLFPDTAQRSFWMKGMKFSLDFVFLSGDQVVAVAENIPFPKEGEQPQIVSPAEEFDKVLEVGEGTIKNWNIKKGDKATFLP